MSENLEKTAVPITVGLCVKNCAKTVRLALESIVLQDYPHDSMNVIAVDGKSTDGTLSIVKEYLQGTDIEADYSSDGGKGLGTARQIVVDRTNGKYVIWVDGDIILPPSYFRDQVSFMEKNPRAGATRGIEGFPKNGQALLAVLEYVSKLRYYSDKRKKTLSTFAGTFRTEAMREVGGFDKDIRGAAEDIDLATRMFEAGWLLFINDARFCTKYRETWRALWHQCEWYGYGGYYVTHKTGSFRGFWARVPPAGFLLGLRDTASARKASNAKISLLLPFYRLVKDLAWWCGYTKGHFDHYKPRAIRRTEARQADSVPGSANPKETSATEELEVPVTIGLCVRNSASTIDETLECIVRQDYPRDSVEVIVVDDGSKDLTLPKILSQLSRFCFTVKVFSTSGQGLGCARQAVVDNASGKYILWIDGDMILPEDHVRLQVKFMEENPELGKARAVWRILNEKTLVSMLESMRVLKRSIRSRRKEYAQGIGGSICRTDALRLIGGFDKRIRGAGEDIDIAVRLAASWKAGISEASFFHHFRQTWRGLWNQYFWYGYGMHFVNRKHRGVVKLWTYLPAAAFLAGARQSFIAFKQTKRGIAFLLPIQFLFKHSAWVYGYLSSHLDGYGHFKD